MPVEFQGVQRSATVASPCQARAGCAGSPRSPLNGSNGTLSAPHERSCNVIGDLVDRAVPCPASHRDVIGDHQQVEAEALDRQGPALEDVRVSAGPKLGTFTPSRTGSTYLAIKPAPDRGGMMKDVNVYGRPVMMPRSRGR